MDSTKFLHHYQMDSLLQDEGEDDEDADQAVRDSDDEDDALDLDLIVSSSCIDVRNAEGRVFRCEMRWMGDASVALTERSRIAFTPEFFQLDDGLANGKTLSFRTANAAEIVGVIQRHKEPVQVPVPAVLSRHHCEFLRPLILRWVPGFCCLSIYVSLTATEYAPYFAGGPYAIFVLFLLGVARLPFLGM